MEQEVTAPVQKTENTAVGIRYADHLVGTNFADKRRSV
jgi:hypothetical protein